jgi:hypothetical protein
MQNTWQDYGFANFDLQFFTATGKTTVPELHRSTRFLNSIFS